MRWSRLLASLCVISGCTGGPIPVDAPEDAPPDANLPPPSPLALSIEDGAGRRLVVETDPLSIRVVDAAGAALVESAGLGLAVGLAGTGSNTFHEPTADVPRGVRWSALNVGVTRASGTEGTIRDAEGNEATVQLASDAPGAFTLHVAMRDPAHAALMRLVLAAGDGHYDGLGERFGGADARGHVVPMQLSVTAGATESSTNEAHVPIPFLVSSEGYGLFVETREAGAFDVAATDPGEVRASFEGAELDLHFFVAERPAEVIGAYTRHTGLPILPPRWASAPMHWRNEWASRAALEEDVNAIRALDIPCTTFWIDNPWQTSYNDHRFDAERFPNPREMLAWMRRQGMRPLVWSTPYLESPEGAATNPAQMLYEVAARDGLLVGSGGAPLSAPSASGCCSGGGMMDFTNEAAITFWQTQLDPLVDLGVRAFKLDYGEDVLPAIGGGRLTWTFSDGRSNRELHNVYSSLYHLPYRRALDEGASEGGFLLVRAEAWGGQSVADLIWPGDLDNDFSVGTGDNVGGLQASVSALVSLAASGFPSFAADTGGYRGGMPTREVLIRWAEHDAFSPFLQLGGGGEHHNPWLYDEEAGRLYARLARAHMDLVPYLRVLALRAHTEGLPPVLHPAMAYPQDRGGYADPNAYLIGEDLFVAVVVEPGATTRALHLPPGRWVHWFTGEAYAGDVTVDAPLGTPPVFLRVGAIVPLFPPDLDTLAEEDVDPSIVRASDRPYLRARILPGEDRTLLTEEGLSIGVSRGPLRVTVTPSTRSTDLRMQIDLDHAEPALAAVTTVSANGTSVAMAPDRASVEAGCDGACWFVDGRTLFASVRSTEPTTLLFE